MAEPNVITFLYKNYEGRIAWRRARVISFRWGSSEWHKVPQMLMLAFDLERDAEREFAVRDIQKILSDPTLKIGV